MFKSTTARIVWACVLLSAPAAFAQDATPNGANANQPVVPSKFKPLKGVPRTEFYWGMLGAMNIPVYSAELLPKTSKVRTEAKVIVFDNCGAGLKHDLMTYIGMETCEGKTMTFEEYAKINPAVLAAITRPAVPTVIAAPAAAPAAANRTVAVASKPAAAPARARSKAPAKKTATASRSKSGKATTVATAGRSKRTKIR